MKSIENKKQRVEMVSMHDFFLKKINNAIDDTRYIEANWLIYACFENRYFRTIEKFKPYCKYSKGKCKKKNNELALRTKIRCIQHLYESKCKCILESFDATIFEETLKWVKTRNKLMHNLLQLEIYEDMDKEFKKLAQDGAALLKRTYNCCTKFRAVYFDSTYEFNFPIEAMEKCQCKGKK